MPFNEVVAQHPAEIQRYARQFGWQLQFAAAQALVNHSWSYIRGLALANRRTRLERFVEGTSQGPGTPEQRLSKKMQPGKKRARARPNEDVANDMTAQTGQLNKVQNHGTLKHVARGGTLSSLPQGPKMSTWWRYQSVRPNTTLPSTFGPSFPLTFQGDRFDSEGFLYAGMPVYCVNLNSIPYSGSTMTSEGQVLTGPAYANGMYRLYKRYSELVNTVNYFWAPVIGRSNTATGVDSYTWQFERKSDPARGYYAPQFYEYQHHYTQAAIQFTGVKEFNYRAFIEVVKFKKEQGPMRGTYGSTTSTVFAAHDGLPPSVGNANYFLTPASRTTTDENNEQDVFWDYKLSKLLGFPLRQPTTSTRHARPYTVLASKSIDMCRVPDDDASDIACLCTADLMYTDGGVYDCSHEDQSIDLVNTRYVPNNVEKKFTYYTQGLSDVSQKTGMFADYTDDTWMMIYAGSTNISLQGKRAGATTPAESRVLIESGNWTLQPGFDIVMRSKYTTLGSGTVAPAVLPAPPVDEPAVDEGMPEVLDEGVV